MGIISQQQTTRISASNSLQKTTTQGTQQLSQSTARKKQQMVKSTRQGVQFQNVVNAEGNIYVKSHLTHKLSFPKQKATNVSKKRKVQMVEIEKIYPAKKQRGPNLNSRCDMSSLYPCIYEQALRQTCHAIQHLRISQLTARMMATKTDLDKAYQRKFISANSAARSMAIVGELLHILFRLPFGISPAPAEWCPIMEMILDLANKLVMCENGESATLKSPWSAFSPKINFDPILPNPPTDFPLSVVVPIDANYPAVVEGFVDDGLAITTGDRKMMERTYECLPLATHVFFQPVTEDESLLRPILLSEPKCKGEGLMAEQKNSQDWIFSSIYTKFTWRNIRPIIIHQN